jgi:3-hydroxyacyl-[acyl-carrier-protein] dehydratase
MTLAQVEGSIPHRPPMRLLDEVVEQGPQRILCRKTFRAEEPFVQGHFPGYPLVPGVIQCECCLQAGAVLLHSITPTEGKIPVATRIDGVKFKQMVRPGDTVDIEVTLNDYLGTAFYMTGRVLLKGKVTARLDFACTVTDPREAAPVRHASE